MNVPLSKPSIGDEELEAVEAVLRSGWLATGAQVAAFEDEFATVAGTGHAVATNSCTSALHVSLFARGVRGEVLVPSFTFVAPVNAIVTAGATPVFVDVDYGSGTIDAQAVAAAVTPRTEGILAAHYAGHPCDMRELQEVATRHSLLLVEDSAEAIGATVGRRPVGSLGDAGCFSFFPTKNVTTGEGGMFTTNDASYARDVRALIAHGIDSTTFSRSRTHGWARDARLAGHNMRMTDMQAAIGRAQLRKLESMNASRRAHASRYIDGLHDVPWVDLPVTASDRDHVYQMFVVKVLPPVDRDTAVTMLHERGVGASVHFDPPVHRQTAHRTEPLVDLPVTDVLSSRSITLPMYPSMSDADVVHVVNSVRSVVHELAGTRE